MNYFMKKLLIVVFYTVLYCVNCNISYGQNVTTGNISSNPNFNLPPGVALPMKFNVALDFSFKINGLNSTQFYKDSELRVGKILTLEQLNSIKEKDPINYNYYSNANVYFTQLSEKVNQLYTKNELWYIYVFDQKLKNKLLTIK